ncbi:ATP-dependent helicase HrpB [Novipirellula artificiosorum]|uniref:ATP-dependent RNA helicase HrpB n=1 Tax=Novipirellula artificiosorum TaxID=2528016 RepID=A0A5C6DAQ0_9BACT|nr:ATP-dependent helicase HrpB [Novipirellula artificiosorum]TWU33768.1 ATP-dependent RNA helicase HrpB [Novipirellula artificiosorum]
MLGDERWDLDLHESAARSVLNPHDPGSEDLPVAGVLPAILQAVGKSAPVILKAPPGAGKTSLVPISLLQAGLVADGQLVLVQPRRLAARGAARRIAHLTGSKLGQQVGYQVRFDRCASPQTKLLVVTPGILLRRLAEDPLLENVGCVILDEFHERSLELDLTLGMIDRIRSTLRPELNLIIMSATLDPAPLLKFLRSSSVPPISVECQGRSFPVNVHYTPSRSRQPIEQSVVETLPDALDQTSGDVLVFLPGVGEIKRVHQRIDSQGIASDFQVDELYGDLSAESQDAVLAPSEHRKIVLATNVAETSVTIPGVTAVIDTGWARVMTFNAAVGMPSLRMQPISQASAEQRAGRAGRTAPGAAWRLWPKPSHAARPKHDLPEIQRADFSAAAMMLAAWGERDPFDFPWLTPPAVESVARAKQLLSWLGAIDSADKLTAIGSRMLRLPVHPRVARFLIAAEDLQVAEDAAIAAALLTERTPFVSGNVPSDLASQVETLQQFFQRKPVANLLVAATKNIQRVADQLLRILASSRSGAGSEDRGDVAPIALGEKEERLRRSLLLAYPDRVAKRRSRDSDKGLMVGGRGVRMIAANRIGASELFVCIDVDDKGTDAVVRMAAPIERDWLSQDWMQSVDEPFYDPTRQAVIARRRDYFHDLILTESPLECKPSPAVAEQLATFARPMLWEWMNDNQRSAIAFVTRVRFVAHWMPEADLPRLDDDAIDDVLVQLCQSRTTIRSLQTAPWLEHLKSRFDYPALQRIDKHAPERLIVPSGNAIRIEYQEGKPPIMAVRLQELFGWGETPRIAAGKVPIQLHLLGPNGRPQQISEDLASFWKHTYANVRKDLRRRYPKHHWPEDPLIAQATRNGLKPR